MAFVELPVRMLLVLLMLPLPVTMVRTIVASLNDSVSRVPLGGIAAKGESVGFSNLPEVAAPAPARSHGFGGLALAIASISFDAAAYALLALIAASRVYPLDLRLSVVEQ